MRLIVTAKCCTCGDADSLVEDYAVFHKHVEDACGKQSAQSTALEYKSFDVTFFIHASNITNARYN